MLEVNLSMVKRAVILQLKNYYPLLILIKYLRYINFYIVPSKQVFFSQKQIKIRSDLYDAD